METMEARSLARAASFTPEQLSNLMLSLATLGWVPREPLVEAMVARIAVTASVFKAQDMANSCWAMAVFIARGVPCYAFDAALKPLAQRSQRLVGIRRLSPLLSEPSLSSLRTPQSSAPNTRPAWRSIAQAGPSITAEP